MIWLQRQSLYANLDKLHQEGVAHRMVTHDVHKAVSVQIIFCIFVKGLFLYSSICEVFRRTRVCQVWHTMQQI